MGYDLHRAFQMETRRLLWLIGVVFTTIVFFQCIELPKGNFLWSVFSRVETTQERANIFFNESESSIPNQTYPVYPAQKQGLGNESSIPILPTNISSPIVEDSTNFLYEEQKNTTYTTLEKPNVNLRSENDPPKSNNASAFETQNEETPLPPKQNEVFSSAKMVPPQAIPPTSLSVNENGHNMRMKMNTSISNEGSLPRNLVKFPPPKAKFDLLSKEVLTLSDMNELLIQSHLSSRTMVPRWSTKTDQDLIFAKSEIMKAPLLNNLELYAPLYHNASMFQRSYGLMEEMLKVYIYKEGDRRIFHRPPLEGIYASEGWFMKLLEANKHFGVKRPEQAHLFYLPFSSRMLEETLYVPNSHNHKNLIQLLKDYRDMISKKYPFWNRTDGADHFLVACHDWAPSETKRHMNNCIRALCNADVKEGFKFGKDVSLPETYVRTARKPLRDLGGKPISKRKTLAFFAGNMHGYLRPILIHHWGKDNNNNNDPDMQIFSTLPYSKGNRNYINYMKTSKYCICPRGYEVNSPRVVEAIFYQCVPVIISDNFVPPFFETLNWESFAVFVLEKDIPNLKNILISIPEKTYLRMYMRVKKVQRHFLWHPKPVKYDLFHMILHSIWYNRVMQFRSR